MLLGLGLSFGFVYVGRGFQNGYPTRIHSNGVNAPYCPPRSRIAVFCYVATALREGLRTFASAASITTLRPGFLTLSAGLDVALLVRSLGLLATTRSTGSGDSVKVFSLGADTLDAF